MPGLEKELYQIVINRLDGDKVSSPSYREEALELVRKGIGGFIVFGGKRDELKIFIDQLQALSEVPLFIASDIERGVGQQVDGATPIPCQMAMAAAINRDNPKDVKILEETMNAVATESIDVGINMPLIPVLDVNRNPDNPIVCTRAFSDDPETVAWYGNRFIKTLEDAGLMSCAKHFPGHGDTAVDSHISLPVISKSLQELNDTDLHPFIEAIKTGVSCIMTGHLSIPAIDELPASLSKKLITDLLRKELGYEGLILTDALNMHALHEFKNVPSMCINAGVDILLHPADADLTVKELKDAVTSGELQEKKIDAAAERILKYKSKIQNIQGEKANYQKNSKISMALSERAITLVKNRPGLLPITDVDDTSLVFTADENRHDLSSIKKFNPESISLKHYKDGELQNTFIAVLFTSIAAWAGSSGIRDEEIKAIRKIINKSRNSIVISFGSPYVLKHFMDADVLIAAYDTTQEAQSSVIKCLKGELDFTGRLPVTL
jgi:beta-glucosidase-like glycosyl hydrolase